MKDTKGNHSKKKKFFRRKSFFVILGIIIGTAITISSFYVSHYFSTNESCEMCHVHPHVHDSWKLSSHVNNRSGMKVNCIDCHLPPGGTLEHYQAKVSTGVRDVWGKLTKDSADFDWESKSQLEYAVKMIPNKSCKNCHSNLFPEGLSNDGVTAHLYYDENEQKLDLQCISCHLDVGHYNPNFKHEKMKGLPTTNTSTGELYTEAAKLTDFKNFKEQIPGTSVSFNMKAIPGGSFQMGSPENEAFRNEDEGPIRNITLSPFYMGELEVTWDMYWAFYAETMSEGRISPETVYANNSNPEVDAISGPTPPFGFPDQGWGAGERPAITMTHYAAQTFCQWLSKKTGKQYRLPTEAEWEYAARGGTTTPYFFEGTANDFSDKGFFRKIFKAKTDSIDKYVVYIKNSNNRTQLPEAVVANPFGLKNMLGNVMEYCSDKYSPSAYAESPSDVTNPKGPSQGDEYVVRGGLYNTDPENVRCAVRGKTDHTKWLKTDPQQPKSIWWYSDIKGIGFRVVCDADNHNTLANH